MKKILILTDTSASIDSNIQNSLNINILPLSIYDQDNNRYLEQTLNMSSKDIYNMMLNGKKFITSCTPVFYIEQLLNTNLDKYDYIIALPISSKWSSQYDHLKTLSNQEIYKNKLYVIDSYEFGANTEYLCKKIFEMINNNDSINSIINYISNFNNYTISFFVCKNLHGLVDSGRAPNVIVKLFKLTNVYPIIKVDRKNHFSGLLKKWDNVCDKLVKLAFNEYGQKLSDENIEQITLLHANYDQYELLKIKNYLINLLQINPNKVLVRDVPIIYAHIVNENAIGLQVVANVKKIDTINKIKKILIN